MVRRISVDCQDYPGLRESKQSGGKIGLDQAIKIPGVHLRNFGAIPEVGFMDPKTAVKVEIEIKYGGYIERQKREVERFAKMEWTPIPEDFDYGDLRGLKKEAVEKLRRFHPASLGQASRISGVSPGDIAVLMVHLRRYHGATVNRGTYRTETRKKSQS